MGQQGPSSVSKEAPIPPARAPAIGHQDDPWPTRQQLFGKSVEALPNLACITN
jgi:hypothetical protein